MVSTLNIEDFRKQFAIGKMSYYYVPTRRLSAHLCLQLQVMMCGLSGLINVGTNVKLWLKIRSSLFSQGMMKLL